VVLVLSGEYDAKMRSKWGAKSRKHNFYRMARMLKGAEARNRQLIQKERAVRTNRHLLWFRLMDPLIMATIIFERYVGEYLIGIHVR
jgi:hypothetical protein